MGKFAEPNKLCLLEIIDVLENHFMKCTPFFFFVKKCHKYILRNTGNKITKEHFKIVPPGDIS